MKKPIEQKMWDFLLQEWDVSLWDIVLRTLWILLLIAGCLVIARLCAWADTGMRGDRPVERSIIPE